MDRLLSTGEQVSMTLLAMAIEARGYKAMSFTGRQAGIETDGTHNKAKIVKVHNERMHGCARARRHSPWSPASRASTPTATSPRSAAAAPTPRLWPWRTASNADVCEIYSDVDGVYTADPRVCPRAKKLDVINYDDMLELSSCRRRRPADARRRVRPQVQRGHPFPFGVLRRRGHLCQGGNRHDGGSRHHRHRTRHVGSEGHHPRRARHVRRGSQACSAPWRATR